MSQPEFTCSYLESKLRERLSAALSFISQLTKEDVLRCDGGCLTELVREFSVAPPICSYRFDSGGSKNYRNR
jgi:hypothetical protein